MRSFCFCNITLQKTCDRLTVQQQPQRDIARFDIDLVRLKVSAGICDRPRNEAAGDRHNKPSAICCHLRLFLSNLSGDGLHF